MKTLERTRHEGCLSDLQLDRLRAGDVRDDERAAFRDHVEGCERCHQRNLEFADIEASFLEAAPRFVRPTGRAEPRRQAPPRHRRFAYAGAAVVSLAAAAAVGLRLRAPDEASGTRLKGNADRITFFVKRGERVFQGESGGLVAPHDQIRFATTTLASKHVVILGLDTENHASVYFPDGDRAATVPVGENVLLPSAIELDNATGEERIFALFCEAPVPIDPIRRSVETGATTFPETCTVDRLTLDKQRLP